jgi:PilZ domain
MQEHGHNKRANYGAAGSPVSVKDAERRGTARHVVTTGADVIEISSGARFSTRTTDLGTGGCFVDTTNPFPVGSKLRLNLHKGKSSFEIFGTVVYSQTGLGMGIAFDQISPDQQVALADWLSEVTGERIPAAEAVQPPKRAEDFQRLAQSAGLVRLVRLLIGKGMLTEAEGTSVLYEPLL